MLQARKRFVRSQDYAEETKKECNGFVELCYLFPTQITFPGSHNSGAGFNGPLEYHTLTGRVQASSCSNRFQDRSIYEQLVQGIRYFDIEVRWVEKYEPQGAWACYKNACAGPVKLVLEQIDLWMNEQFNRNEVIVLNFRNGRKKKGITLAGSDVIEHLLNKWEPSNPSNNFRELSIQPSLDVTIGDAVRQNQRIYIIMDNDLVIGHRKKWIIPHWVVGVVSQSMSFIRSRGCYNLMKRLSGFKCQKEAAHTFVRYDMFLKIGLCRKHLAKYCRKFISGGVKKCFLGTSLQRRTVNFIVVDYADDDVIMAARKQNVENIQFFLNKLPSNNPEQTVCDVLQRLDQNGIPIFVGNKRIVFS